MPAGLSITSSLALPCTDCGGKVLSVTPAPTQELDPKVQSILSTVLMTAKAKAAMQGVTLELKPGESPIVLIPPAEISRLLGVRCRDCQEAKHG